MSLKTLVSEKINGEIRKELGIQNTFQIPRIEKIIVNVGIGTYVAKVNSDYSPIVQNVTDITGQTPTVKKARISVSNFNKLRAGQPNGVTVTLRGEKMYDFLERLIHIVLPRVRDFKGISDKQFDGRGNLNIGIKDHTVFPEVKVQDAVKPHGVQITIVTSADNNSDAKLLLEKMRFPFKKKKS